MTTEQRERDNDEQVLSTQEKLEHLYSLIDGIEVAMLTSHDAHRALVSRPMATQQATNGGIWFVTSTQTHKLDELRADPRVNLAYYKDRTREFVSVSGLARVNQDRAKIAEQASLAYVVWRGRRRA